MIIMNNNVMKITHGFGFWQLDWKSGKHRQMMWYFSALNNSSKTLPKPEVQWSGKPAIITMIGWPSTYGNSIDGHGVSWLTSGYL